MMKRAASIIIALLMALISTNSSAAPRIRHFGVTIHDPAKAYQGYTIFVDMIENSDAGVGKAYLIDMDGAVVHTWKPKGYRLYHMALPLWKGRILTRLQSENGGYRKLALLDWNGKKLWEYYNAGEFRLHHDHQWRKDGALLLLASTKKLVPAIAPFEIWDDRVVCLDKNSKEILWNWNTSDHYDELGLTDEAREIIYNGETSFKKDDPFHTNSIQALPPNPHEETDSRFAEGNILVSQRRTNKVFIFDPVSGDVVWVLSKPTIGQHHARMIPPGLPGAGNILVFDNGMKGGYPAETRPFSRVIEVNPKTQKLVWKYKDDFPYGFDSPARGSAQRLPNGDTLICESQFGRFFEVTPEGEIVWEYIHRFEGNNAVQRDIYRAYRVDYAWPDGPASPGWYGPWSW